MMETSLSTILAPADTILQLLMLPKFIYFCAVFAYDGFKNGVTLTHGGMRKGVIAKVYGVFYTFFVLFSIILIPVYVIGLLATDVDKIKQALFFAAPIPEIGYFFIGISLFMFLFKEGLTRFSKKKKFKKMICSKNIFLNASLSAGNRNPKFTRSSTYDFCWYFCIFHVFWRFCFPANNKKCNACSKLRKIL